MVEPWVLWLVIVGTAIGVAVTFVLLVRLPRDEDDVGTDERWTEASWISGTIERHGGVAPESFVAEVLDLHAAYLRVQRPPAPPRGTPPAVPPGYAPGPPPPPRMQAVPPPGSPPLAGPPAGAQPRSRIR